MCSKLAKLYFDIPQGLERLYLRMLSDAYVLDGVGVHILGIDH